MNLQRFHIAQGHGPNSAYQEAIAELRSGRKQGHWIWFVLPQLRGLGHSEMSQYYGIKDLTEARAYLADPVLNQRLEEAINLISMQLMGPGMRLSNLMGGRLDAAKTISSLTLFSLAGLVSAQRLMDQLGRSCRATHERLKR
ncbi:MAG: DUF1810 family protein [Cyanobacteria bacterium]|nr:DUF1810 family protein [Cyanobacteriota bacterium]